MLTDQLHLYGDCGLIVITAVYWNKLLGYIRNIQNFENFKKHLKDIYFQRTVWALCGRKIEI